MEDIVHKKNIDALADGLKQIRQQFEDINNKVDGLQRTVAQQQNIINDQQQKIAILQAKSQGFGATAN